MADIAADHPKQKLLFFVAENVSETLRLNVRDFVLQLAALRRWVNGPPQFVNTREEPQALTVGDLPVETLGGYLELYSAWPPWTLPRDIDQMHLDEVTDLVNSLGGFSREHQVRFELELDGTFVGTVDNGELDRSLAEGLLGEWRRQLGASG